MTSARAPEVLQDIYDHASHIMGTTVDPETANRLARELVDALREIWGGQLIYFAKGNAMDITDRDMAMWAAFNGNNQDALASDFCLSLKTVYERLRKVRDAKISESQGDLFPGK